MPYTLFLMKLVIFLKSRIDAYGRDPGNQRRPDLDRFEKIEKVKSPDVGALFVGKVDLASKDASWWEIWARRSLAESIIAAAQSAEFEVHPDRLEFPDSTVIYIHGLAEQIAVFSERIPGSISEIRRATGTIETFLADKGGEVGQQDWVDELAGRVSPAST